MLFKRAILEKTKRTIDKETKQCIVRTHSRNKETRVRARKSHNQSGKRIYRICEVHQSVFIRTAKQRDKLGVESGLFAQINNLSPHKWSDNNKLEKQVTNRFYEPWADRNFTPCSFQSPSLMIIGLWERVGPRNSQVSERAGAKKPSGFRTFS